MHSSSFPVAPDPAAHGRLLRHLFPRNDNSANDVTSKEFPLSGQRRALSNFDPSVRGNNSGSQTMAPEVHADTLPRERRPQFHDPAARDLRFRESGFKLHPHAGVAGSVQAKRKMLSVATIEKLPQKRRSAVHGARARIGAVASRS